MKQHAYKILLVTLLTTACTKQGTVSFGDTPIIESYVMADAPFSFLVTHQIPFDSEVEYTDEELESIVLSIIYQNKEYLLSPLDSGLFVDSTLKPAAGEEISFSFTYKDKEVSGSTSIPAKTLIDDLSTASVYVTKRDSNSVFTPGGGAEDPVELSWTNSDGSMYLVVIENIEDDPEPVQEFYDEDGELIDRPAFSFRKQPTTSDLEQIRPMEFEYYGTHRIILFHVLSDYATLYESTNTSSQNLENPSTNIANAYGIFTGLNSDTVFIEVKKS